jgi:alpha-amylase/alpha-mannosidase (GH57 family)
MNMNRSVSGAGTRGRTASLLIILAVSSVAVLSAAQSSWAGPPRRTEKGIEFQFNAPTARAVYLGGEFNNWSQNADAMTKGEDGIFRIAKQLAPGTYQYKYIIDGTWKEDPDNPAKTPDPYGGSNSVLVILQDGAVSLAVPKAPSPTPLVDKITASGRPIYFALLWHQHQPRYERDPRSGEYLDPWVRLHCTKDYYDMAAMVTEFDGLKFSVNLTPVLMFQIEDIVQGYEKGGATDKALRVSSIPAESLTPEEKQYMLGRFFDADWKHQIDVFPRYAELRDRRLGFSSEKLLESVPLYSAQDFRDLQLWFNLAWFDPDFLKGPVALPSGETVDLSDLVKKGSSFTEAEKKRVLDAGVEIMRNVIPVHKKLQDAGRIEVTTTPFYHPILPLIYDTDLASIAMQAARLPSERFSFPEDAAEQVNRAASYYETRFGRKPKGMWPGEGAVAQEVIQTIADGGFKWVATDVENLAYSLNNTDLSAPEKFTIYRGADGGKSLGLVFRDAGLSNDIGFRFSQMDPVAAANDFIQNLSNIQKSLAPSDRDHIVVVILDGENAWQNYDNDGKDFLRALYSQLAKASWVKTTTVSDFLGSHPLEQLPLVQRLWAGSWDGHSFATWIGEPEENLAWEYLAKARREFGDWKKGLGARKGTAADDEAAATAYNLLLAAEGSDWFWWYGKDKDSGNDERFDEAFRNTLKQVYATMSKQAPAYLDEPILGAGATQARKLPGMKETVLLSMDDPLGDDKGPGGYTYPTDPVFVKGAYDIRHFEVSEDTTDVIFRISIAGELTDPWGGDLGYCLQGVDIYIDTDGKPGSGSRQLFMGRNAFARSGSEWEFAVMANMDEVGLYDSGLKPVAQAKVGAWGDPVTRSMTVRVPKASVGKPDKNWKVIAFLVGHDGYSSGRVRPITPTAQEWTFGGSTNPSEPRIMDVVVPPGQNQKDVLGAFGTQGAPVELSGVNVIK